MSNTAKVAARLRWSRNSNNWDAIHNCEVSRELSKTIKYSECHTWTGQVCVLADWTRGDLEAINCQVCRPRKRLQVSRWTRISARWCFAPVGHKIKSRWTHEEDLSVIRQMDGGSTLLGRRVKDRSLRKQRQIVSAGIFSSVKIFMNRL